MRLTGKQYQQLTDALIDAFPSQQRLAELVKFRLEKNLNAIAMGDDLKEIIFKQYSGQFLKRNAIAIK